MTFYGVDNITFVATNGMCLTRFGRWGGRGFSISGTLFFFFFFKKQLVSVVECFAIDDTIIRHFL